MSTTGTSVVTEARRILGDNAIGNPVFAEDLFKQSVNRQVALIAKELGLGSQWVTSIVTLGPGTLDYTFTGTSEYEQVIDLIYHNDRVPLPIRGLGEIEDARSGAIATGRPSKCALRPNTTQGVVLMVDTNPTETETLDGLVSILPTPWLLTDSTPPTIPFSTTATRALELRVAASLAATAGPEKLNALAMDKKDAEDWRREAAALITAERLTIIRLKRSRGLPYANWFSRWAR